MAARKKKASTGAKKVETDSKSQEPTGRGSTSASGKSKSKKTDTSDTVEPSSRKARADESADSFPVVGIGASAGGLEALEIFLNNLPPDSGAAFVVVAHLDPTHVSILPELLQKRTAMTVSQIKDGMHTVPDHIYVIPPNKEVKIFNGRLHLFDLSMPRGVNLPIDSFFRSLAQDQGAGSVCIVLSGTGSDGTLGLREIKGSVGMVMVQDVESARYDGMPRSAIATGLVDYILPPDRMPERLLEYIRHASRDDKKKIVFPEDQSLDSLQKIFLILRARTDHDFSLYKKNTICRRIERRMHVHQIDDVTAYVRFLRENEKEVETLFKELLIGVTNFFRDPGAFQALRSTVLPGLLDGKPDDYTIRVWVPGCSSGEEAYSIAILLDEIMGELGCRFNVQVFGTDIDVEAIAIARSGVYPASISADLEPERLRRYFVKEDDGNFRIRKTIREMLVFAPQNVIKDPPFTRLDLICCRNLMIYLGPELQKKLLLLFHYSLKPGGALFLGSSESVGQSTDLFRIIDRKWKIFRPAEMSGSSRPVPPFPGSTPPLLDDEPPPSGTVREAEEISALQLAETVLRQADAPPCAIVDSRYDVVYIHGHTGRYLEPAEGKMSVNILEMARSGLKSELASAVAQAAAHKQAVVRKKIGIDGESEKIHVDLEVKPILEQGALRDLLLVTFRETEIRKGKKKSKKPSRSGGERKSAEDYERELLHTRETLQTAIEELEASNEELKSTNEELQSTNEELQSTNEEMETSKEELQSLNEESVTVNAELQSRIDELSKANDDMKNLLDSTEIATIFLDTDLCVRRFTPAATMIVPLTATDAGRPIRHFVSNLVAVDLHEIAGRVLDDLAIVETEAACGDERNFVMRVRPYRTMNNVIDGVVITFEDNTVQKRFEQALASSEAMYKTIFENHLDASFVVDAGDGSLLDANSRALNLSGYSLEKIRTMPFARLFPPDRQGEMTRLFQAAAKDPTISERWDSELQNSESTGIPVTITTTHIIIADQPALILVFHRTDASSTPHEEGGTL